MTTAGRPAGSAGTRPAGVQAGQHGTTDMRIEMQCRDCGQTSEQPFTRPPVPDEPTDPEHPRPHHYRCGKCGGVLDPTEKGLRDWCRRGLVS